MWQLVDGGLRFAALELGRFDLDGNVQVREGLAVGDRVVVYSATSLTARSRVQVVERLP